MTSINSISNKLSFWVTLKTKHFKKDVFSTPEIYHSFEQHDYVSIFAIRTDHYIPIVRQFRPAIEKHTLELPGGLVDKDVLPEVIAKSELYEETGHEIVGNLSLLGCLVPDPGRLENRLWGYFTKVSSEVSADWKQEDGVELILLSKSEFKSMICNGSFNNALHIGLIGLSITKGLFSW